MRYTAPAGQAGLLSFRRAWKQVPLHELHNTQTEYITMKKTLITLLALAGAAAGETITLAIPAGGTNNGGHGSTSATAALTNYANSNDGGYMFNNGGQVTPDTSFNEGILRTDGEGLVCLTLAPRTGAGGSGEAIVLSGTELNGYEVDSLTFSITSSSCSSEGSVALTLAVIEKDTDKNTWSVKQSSTGTLTMNSGAEVNLTLGSAIEWSDSYKVVAMIDNTAKTLGGGNSPTYTMTGISVTATGTPVVPEPATATLSLLALAGFAARRRRS